MMRAPNFIHIFKWHHLCRTQHFYVVSGPLFRCEFCSLFPSFSIVGIVVVFHLVSMDFHISQGNLIKTKTSPIVEPSNISRTSFQSIHFHVSSERARIYSRSELNSASFMLDLSSSKRWVTIPRRLVYRNRTLSSSFEPISSSVPQSSNGSIQSRLTVWHRNKSFTAFGDILPKPTTSGKKPLTKKKNDENYMPKMRKKETEYSYSILWSVRRGMPNIQSLTGGYDNPWCGKKPLK